MGKACTCSDPSDCPWLHGACIALFGRAGRSAALAPPLLNERAIGRGRHLPGIKRMVAAPSDWARGGGPNRLPNPSGQPCEGAIRAGEGTHMSPRGSSAPLPVGRVPPLSAKWVEGPTQLKITGQHRDVFQLIQDVLIIYTPPAGHATSVRRLPTRTPSALLSDLRVASRI